MQELCPRCGQLKPEDAPCRQCGPLGGDRGAGAQPPDQTGFSGSPLDDPLADAVELPSLELAPVASPRRTSALNPAGQPRMAGVPDEGSLGPAMPAAALAGNPTTTDQAGAAPGDSAPDGGGPPVNLDAERQARLRVISRYRPPPQSPLQWVPYYIGIFLQRRVVAEELATLTRARQRMERELVDGLCRIGEKLYVERRNPALAPLARHFDVVTQADSDVDAREETGQQARTDATRTLEGLHAKLAAATERGEPLYMKRSQLQGQLDKLRAQYIDHQKALKAAELALKTVDGTDAGAIERWTQQKRKAASDMQSTELTAHPVRSALDEVEHRIQQHQQQVGDLQIDLQRQQATTDRTLSRHADRSGSARSALQATLQSLAEAAIRDNLLLPGLAASGQQVEARRVRVTEALVTESLHREALGAYDHQSYRRGKATLIGGTALTFVALVARMFL